MIRSEKKEKNYYNFFNKPIRKIIKLSMEDRRRIILRKAQKALEDQPTEECQRIRANGR